MTNDTDRQPLDPAALRAVVDMTGNRARFPDRGPTPLLEEAMQFIERHPERHDQTVWMDEMRDLGTAPDDVPICGTAGCLAGWGVALNDPLEGQQIIEPGLVVLADQQSYAEVEVYAAHLFGITSEQASALFASHWMVYQLRRGVDAIKANPGIDGLSLYRVMRG